MSLIRLIVLLIVIGLLIWLVGFLPLPYPIATIITTLGIVACVVLVIVWLLRLAGFNVPGPPL